MMERLRSRQAGHWGVNGAWVSAARFSTPRRLPRPQVYPMFSGTRVTNSWCSARPELLQQKRLHRARERPLAFQPHRSQTAALLQNALHVLAVVLALLLGAFRRIEIGVAGHADDVGVLDRVHREDLGGEHLDRVLYEHERQAGAGQLDHTARLARQGDDAQRHALRSEVLRGLGLALGLIAGALLLRLLRLEGAPPHRGARRCTGRRFPDAGRDAAR